MKIYERNIEDVIRDYYSYLSDKIINVLPAVPTLLLEVYKGIDPCWFWALKNHKIIGALVYTLDQNSTIRKLTIHHVSCLVFSLFQKFLEATTNFLFVEDPCSEIRVNLLIPLATELPIEIKKVFTNLKFK